MKWWESGTEPGLEEVQHCSQALKGCIFFLSSSPPLPSLAPQLHTMCVCVCRGSREWVAFTKGWAEWLGWRTEGRHVGKSGSISVGVVALTPMTQHCGENKQEDQELKAILSYIVSFEQHGLHKTLPQSKHTSTYHSTKSSYLSCGLWVFTWFSLSCSLQSSFYFPSVFRLVPIIWKAHTKVTKESHEHSNCFYTLGTVYLFRKDFQFLKVSSDLSTSGFDQNNTLAVTILMSNQSFVRQNA